MEMRLKIIICFVPFTKCIIVRWQWSWSRESHVQCTISACFWASELTLFAREFFSYSCPYEANFKKYILPGGKLTFSEELTLNSTLIFQVKQIGQKIYLRMTEDDIVLARVLKVPYIQFSGIPGKRQAKTFSRVLPSFFSLLPSSDQDIRQSR